MDFGTFAELFETLIYGITTLSIAGISIGFLASVPILLLLIRYVFKHWIL